ncbi:FUSC family protein [Acinetobacter ursingii]|uniref:FUSC family protein n=1 Tax=Acinetobacter ursingii TaxID=108980 RepID=UPI00313A7A83
MNKSSSAQIQYIIKILTCTIIISIISITFDKDKTSNFFLWATLTSFFTLQADQNIKVNFNQITGNIIGSIVGILIWFLIFSASHYVAYINLEYWFLILGIFLTTLICIIVRHTEYCGIALASFLIVTIYDVAHQTIEGTLFRIVFCAAGCFIAYLVDIAVRRWMYK